MTYHPLQCLCFYLISPFLSLADLLLLGAQLLRGRGVSTNTTHHGVVTTIAATVPCQPLHLGLDVIVLEENCVFWKPLSQPYPHAVTQPYGTLNSLPQSGKSIALHMLGL